MKKILALMITLFFCSCSIFFGGNNSGTGTNLEDIEKISSGEEINKDELNIYFDYPVFENSEIDKKIKNWGKSVIKETGEQITEMKKSGIKKIKPELHATFLEHKDNGVKSIVYNISKTISEKFPEMLIKIFYLDENGNEINKNDIFKFKTDLQKEHFQQKILNKTKTIEGSFKNTDVLENSLKKYYQNMKFYFDNDRVIFLFDPYVVGPYSEGVLEIEFYFIELEEYLNEDIFPKIKEERLKREKKAEERRKLEEDKKRQEEERNKAMIEDNKKILNTNNGKKYIALTFDDGPSNKTTPDLLDILKNNDIKATFFVLGKNASYFPELIKREHEEGHEIANHSWDHPNLVNLKDKAVKKQIEDTDNEIKKIIGITPSLIRPPYGSHNKRIDNIINGKTIVLWNVDSRDWKNRNVNKNLETTLPQVKNGSIILFHDIHRTSVNTIDTLIKKLKSKGYEFLTVTELLKLNEEDLTRKICNGEFNCYSY